MSCEARTCGSGKSTFFLVHHLVQGREQKRPIATDGTAHGFQYDEGKSCFVLFSGNIIIVLKRYRHTGGGGGRKKAKKRFRSQNSRKNFSKLKKILSMKDEKDYYVKRQARIFFFFFFFFIGLGALMNSFMDHQPDRSMAGS